MIKKICPMILIAASIVLFIIPLLFAESRTLEVTYGDGSTQSLMLNQPSERIRRMEFKDGMNQRQQSNTIKIIEAKYGKNNRNCDATGFVISQCDGKMKCQFTTTNAMCGDPLYGTKKEIIVKYTCGYASERYGKADENSTLSISCE